MPKYKIIIVDDDPDDRFIINEAFKIQGFTHHLTLTCFQELVEYLQSVAQDEDLPRLIVTDLNMPGTSGYDLLKSLKSMERYQNIDVVVFSTAKTDAHKNSAIELGARDYIPKPTRFKDYLAMVSHFSKEIL